jgi:hypothetical protein
MHQFLPCRCPTETTVLSQPNIQRRPTVPTHCNGYLRSCIRRSFVALAWSGQAVSVWALPKKEVHACGLVSIPYHVQQHRVDPSVRLLVHRAGRLLQAPTQ